MIRGNIVRDLPILGAVVLAALVYGNAFEGVFQFDDSTTISENPHLLGLDVFISHLDHMVRPLLYATFLFDRSLYGNSPGGYHLLNLLLHLGSGFLVYRILTRAVTEEMRHVPFWTALLFLIHPIQTETITYISGRASGLMAFWYLSALFLYIKGSEDTSGHVMHRLYRAGAVFCFMLSLASKEPAVTFPLALLLWDVVVRRLRGAALRSATLTGHSPFWLIIVVAGVLACLNPRYADLAHFSFTLRPLWDNLLSEIHAAGYALLLFPRPWKQNFDHDLPLLHSLLQWPLLVDLLVLGCLLAAGVVQVRRLPLFSFGVGWFFLQLLPISVIPRNDLLSERNLYLASVGLFLAFVMLASQGVVWLSQTLGHPRLVRRMSLSLTGVIVVGLCAATIQRNHVYIDQISLWSDTVSKSPHKARPHNNLGHAYALHGEWDRAIEEFRIAARLDPDYALAQNNLRNAYLHRVGRP